MPFIHECDPEDTKAHLDTISEHFFSRFIAAHHLEDFWCREELLHVVGVHSVAMIVRKLVILLEMAILICDLMSLNVSCFPWP